MNWTATLSAVCTTWAAVMICPLVLISTPEPSPGMVVRPTAGFGDMPRSNVRTSTTEGLTLRNSEASCCACAGTGTGIQAPTDTATTHANGLTDPPVGTGILTARQGCPL